MLVSFLKNHRLVNMEVPLIEGRADAQIRMALPAPEPTGPMLASATREVEVEAAQRETLKQTVIAQRLQREKETLRSEVQLYRDGVEVRRLSALVELGHRENKIRDEAFERMQEFLTTTKLDKHVREGVNDIVQDMVKKLKRYRKRAATEME